MTWCWSSEMARRDWKTLHAEIGFKGRLAYRSGTWLPECNRDHQVPKREGGGSSSRIWSINSGLSFFTLPTALSTFHAVILSVSKGRRKWIGGRSGSAVSQRSKSRSG